MTASTATVTLTADDATAKPLVTFVKAEVRDDKKRDGLYAAYVETHADLLTADDTKIKAIVAAHVKALTTLAFPGVTPSNKDNASQRAQDAKNFQNKVRNGLNRALGNKASKTPDADGTVRVTIKGVGSFVFAPGTDAAASITAIATGTAGQD